MALRFNYRSALFELKQQRIEENARPGLQLRERPRPKIDRLPQGESRAEGSRVGDDPVAAFEEMAKHLRGEIELEGILPVKAACRDGSAHE